MTDEVFKGVFVSANDSVPPPAVGQRIMSSDAELIITAVTELEERHEDGNRKYDLELRRVLQ